METPIRRLEIRNKVHNYYKTNPTSNLGGEIAQQIQEKYRPHTCGKIQTLNLILHLQLQI